MYGKTCDQAENSNLSMEEMAKYCFALIAKRAKVGARTNISKQSVLFARASLRASESVYLGLEAPRAWYFALLSVSE